MKNRLIIIFGLLITVHTYAQENYSFSLQEAINYALKNNTNIKNADLSILAAKQQVWETTARAEHLRKPIK